MGRWDCQTCEQNFQVWRQVDGEKGRRPGRVCPHSDTSLQPEAMVHVHASSLFLPIPIFPSLTRTHIHTHTCTRGVGWYRIWATRGKKAEILQLLVCLIKCVAATEIRKPQLKLSSYSSNGPERRGRRGGQHCEPSSAAAKRSGTLMAARQNQSKREEFLRTCNLAFRLISAFLWVTPTKNKIKKK